MERGGPPTGGSSVAFLRLSRGTSFKISVQNARVLRENLPGSAHRSAPFERVTHQSGESNHSAFLSCILRTNAFDGYECCAVEKAADKNDDDDFVVTGVQTALLAKHVLGCLRSNRVDRVRIKMKESNGEKLRLCARAEEEDKEDKEDKEDNFKRRITFTRYRTRNT